jgi:hypothetical protein
MASRQTRVFVLSTEQTADWAETLIGRVFRQTAGEFHRDLKSFWFSRYTCQLDGREDRGDCDFDKIPEDYKQVIHVEGGPTRIHRSLRFRFEIDDHAQSAFEGRLKDLLAQHSYAISDIRDFDQVEGLGGHRFLGTESRVPGRDERRAELVTLLLQAVSQLVVDGLVGPDHAGRYRIESNDDKENPIGSTFESIHHMFCNISGVPLSVFLKEVEAKQVLGTYWGTPRGNRTLLDGQGQPVLEVFLPY